MISSGALTWEKWRLFVAAVQGGIRNCPYNPWLSSQACEKLQHPVCLSKFLFLLKSLLSINAVSGDSLFFLSSLHRTSSGSCPEFVKNGVWKANVLRAWTQLVYLKPSCLNAQTNPRSLTMEGDSRCSGGLLSVREEETLARQQGAQAVEFAASGDQNIWGSEVLWLPAPWVNGLRGSGRPQHQLLPSIPSSGSPQSYSPSLVTAMPWARLLEPLLPPTLTKAPEKAT